MGRNPGRESLKVKFLNILKANGRVVGVVAGAPVARAAIHALPWGGLIASVISAVASAQERIPAKGAGESRGAYAIDILEAIGPSIIASFETADGRSVIDANRFALGVHQIMEGIVSIAKAKGQLESAEATK